MGNYRHKILVERAMKRLDERTPMDQRTDSRFVQKPTTKAPDMIQKKAMTAVYALAHGDFDERKNLVEKALEGYNYDDIAEVDGADGKRILVKNLGFCELAEDGFVNDLAIIGRFKTAVADKIAAVNDEYSNIGEYIKTYFDKYAKVDKEYGDVFGNLTISFIPKKIDVNLSTKEGQLEGLKIYDKVVSELKAHVVALTLEVEKFADQWDNAYRRTWGKDESIAYADLPWAEKTQTTVNEGTDSPKLFGNKKRLNEAIDRMFEDAVEIGANLKTEEEMMSK